MIFSQTAVDEYYAEKLKALDDAKTEAYVAIAIDQWLTTSIQNGTIKIAGAVLSLEDALTPPLEDYDPYFWELKNKYDEDATLELTYSNATIRITINRPYFPDREPVDVDQTIPLADPQLYEHITTTLNDWADDAQRIHEQITADRIQAQQQKEQAAAKAARLANAAGPKPLITGHYQNKNKSLARFRAAKKFQIYAAKITKTKNAIKDFADAMETIQRAKAHSQNQITKKPTSKKAPKKPGKARKSPIGSPGLRTPTKGQNARERKRKPRKPSRRHNAETNMDTDLYTTLYNHAQAIATLIEQASPTPIKITQLNPHPSEYAGQPRAAMNLSRILHIQAIAPQPNQPDQPIGHYPIYAYIHDDYANITIEGQWTDQHNTWYHDITLQLADPQLHHRIHAYLNRPASPLRQIPTHNPLETITEKAEMREAREDWKTILYFAPPTPWSSTQQ